MLAVRASRCLASFFKRERVRRLRWAWPALSSRPLGTLVRFSGTRVWCRVRRTPAPLHKTNPVSGSALPTSLSPLMGYGPAPWIFRGR